jgi:hypothetical protein
MVVAHVEDEDPQVARAAIMSLAQQKSDELAKYLGAAYKKADRVARAEFIPLLGRLPAEEAKSLLGQTARSLAKDDRWAVARHLEVYPVDIAYSCVTILIEDKEASIRFAVAVFLAKRENDDVARKLLARLAGDPDKKVAQLAKEAITPKAKVPRGKPSEGT